MRSPKNKNQRKIKQIGLGLFVLLAVFVLGYVLIANNNSDDSLSSNSGGQASENEAGTNEDEDIRNADLPEGSTVEPPEVNLEDIEEYTIPVETLRYSISEESDGYVITLFAIINRPEQYDDYIEQLTTFKAEALDYLQKSGVDTNTASITYIPDAAEEL